MSNIDSVSRPAYTLDARLNESPLHADEIHKILQYLGAQELDLELLKAQGYPLESEDNAYFLTTKSTPYTQQRFCFVDIETTGAKPKEAQIIEIGAVAYQNGKITGKFEEFIYAPFVPDVISEITNITSDMLKDSRKIKPVLQDFKEFLGQSVFVAHNVGFDYGFLSHSLKENGFGALFNPKLCTINLAKQTILSVRYSLQHLNTFLGINTPVAHRAYADALTSLKIFEIALMCLPKHIHTTQDLIDFSRKKL